MENGDGYASWKVDADSPTVMDLQEKAKPTQPCHRHCSAKYRGVPHLHHRQVLQNKGLCCALNKDKDTSNEEMYNEVNLLKLKYRCEQHLLNFMFDMSWFKDNMQKPNVDGVRTRPAKKY